MRSDKVFEALQTLQNRYMLCQIASKATRKFHKPNTRIQDTTNEVLNRISDNERDSVMAEPVNANEQLDGILINVLSRFPGLNDIFGRALRPLEIAGND